MPMTKEVGSQCHPAWHLVFIYGIGGGGWITWRWFFLSPVCDYYWDFNSKSTVALPCAHTGSALWFILIIVPHSVASYECGYHQGEFFISKWQLRSKCIKSTCVCYSEYWKRFIVMGNREWWIMEQDQTSLQWNLETGQSTAMQC